VPERIQLPAVSTGKDFTGDAFSPIHTTTVTFDGGVASHGYPEQLFAARFYHALTLLAGQEELVLQSTWKCDGRRPAQDDHAADGAGRHVVSVRTHGLAGTSSAASGT
jgi:hypothetical protein